MKGKKGIVIAAVLFAAFMAGAFFLYGKLTKGYNPSLVTEADSAEMQQNETKSEAVPAPDFTVYDADGNAVKLSDFYGKPMIINFWASWCGPCRMEMPEFQSAYDEYGDEINFVIVNMTDGQRETVESASGFIADSGYTFPVYYDTDMDAASTYGVYSLPTTYFADSDGNLVAYGKSALTSEMMAEGISRIYKQ